MNNDNENRNHDANRDPITGAPGAHPVGTGLGTVVGGLAGKGVAEAIDPTRESAYWSENFSGRNYVEQGSTFDDVERLGHQPRSIQPELGAGQARGARCLESHHAVELTGPWKSNNYSDHFTDAILALVSKKVEAAPREPKPQAQPVVRRVYKNRGKSKATPPACQTGC